MANEETQDALGAMRRITLEDIDVCPARGSETYRHIVEKVKSEMKSSLDYVQPRRVQFRDRFRLYNNQRKQRDKIGITTIYTMMNTLLAVSYTDELTVGYGGRGFAGTDIAENMEYVAKNDQEEMGMDVMYYLTQWDRYFFGVGIRTVHGWDEDCQVPFAESLDPMCWLPDPKGGISPENFRFFGFEVEMVDADMSEDRGFFDTESLVASYKPSSETEETQQAYAEAQGLAMPENPRFQDKSDDMHSVVHWFTVIGGHKYMLTLAEEGNRIIRFQRIKPVFKKEKANPANIPWPISLNYYSPERTNPFGTSVPDLTEDKQRAKSVMANLKVAKEKADLYPMYLYNRDKILNRRDLDFAFNKMIGVRGEVGDNVVAPLRKDQNRVMQTSNVEADIDREAAYATGAGPQQAGAGGAAAPTLGQDQQVQANANLRFLLGSTVNAWGDKQFWQLHYRCYVQYFPKAEQKVLEITTAFGTQPLSLFREQFITENAPKIIIKSKLASDAERERQRIAFTATAPLVLQDPSKPAVSRRFTERHLLRLNNIPSFMVNVMVPPTPDEMTAHQENELLSRNKLVKITMDEDHLSHIVVHESAADSTATRQHIQAHKEAYVLSGQMERDRAAQLAAAQNAAAIAPQGAAQAGAQGARMSADSAPKQNASAGAAA